MGLDPRKVQCMDKGRRARIMFGEKRNNRPVQSRVSEHYIAEDEVFVTWLSLGLLTFSLLFFLSS
jgi:hypothetical protein